MQLTKQQITHVAKLANLPLTDEELEKYGAQLSGILDYVDQLDKANVEGVIPTYNVTDLRSEVSAKISNDVQQKSLTQAEALQNASLPQKGFFVTKGVFEE